MNWRNQLTDLSVRNRIFLGVIFLYALYISLQLVRHKQEHFWDFTVYYHAADSEVKNPYNDEEIFAKQEWKGKKLGYKYPPLTRYIFKPFHFLSHNQATYLYVFLLFSAIVMMIVIWSRMFKIGADPWFYLVFILGFNASLYLALRSGNITIVLSCFIWLGIYNYVKGKYLWFVLFIFAAAIFKVTPIVLLSLLLFVPRSDRNKNILIAGVLGTSYLIANYMMADQFGFFREGLRELTDEFGIVSPNMLALSRELSHHVFNYYLGLSNWENIGNVMFLGFVALFLGITLKHIVKHKASFQTDKLKQVCIVLLTYFLILPRVKDYDFLMLAPVAYCIIRCLEMRSVYMLLAVLCMSAMGVKLPGFKFLFPLIWDYFPLVLVVALWLFIVKNKVIWGRSFSGFNNDTSSSLD